MSSDFIRTASPELRTLIPDDLTAFLAGASQIKHNPVRDVFKKGDIFIKIDHRKAHTFKSEFACGLALEKAGIPVVSHLLCGRIGDKNFLFTRELAGAVPADGFLKQDNDKTLFVEAFEKLMQQWGASRFFHTDPHFGNLLYCQNENKLYLVDVHDVRRPLFFCKSSSDITRFIFNLRGRLPAAAILELLKKFNTSDPEKLFYKMAAKEIARIKAQWPKRCAQLFNAYPKFSDRCGDWLIAADFKDNFDALPEESSANGRACFAADCFLELMQIPHRRCIAVNENSGSVRFEPPLQGTPEESEKAFLMRQLNMCGFDIDPANCSVRHGIAALNDISVIADHPFFNQEK